MRNSSQSRLAKICSRGTCRNDRPRPSFATVVMFWIRVVLSVHGELVGIFREYSTEYQFSLLVASSGGGQQRRPALRPLFQLLIKRHSITRKVFVLAHAYDPNCVSSCLNISTSEQIPASQLVTGLEHSWERH